MLFSKKDLFRMVLPMMIQQVLAITVGTVDSIMVASAGEAAVAGVALVGMLDSLLVITFSSLVTGGAVTVSHALGGGDRAQARECAKQLIYITCMIALVVAAATGLFRKPLLSALYGSAEADVMTNANRYFGIVVMSFPFLALYSSGAAIFRTMGDTMTDLRLSLLANAINVAGNAVFIYGLKMGAAGAALGTLIARAVVSVAVIWKLHSRSRDIYLERMLHYRPNAGIIRKMLRIGVPHGIESSMFQFGRLATQVLISGMGTAAIAANSVALTLANYLYMPSSAIGNAVITVVGRSYGAGEREQSKKYARLLLFWEYLCMWAVSLFLLALGRPIIGVYHLSAEGTQIAMQLTIFHCICVSVLRPLGFNLPSVFKATGDTRYTLVVSTLSMWIVRVGFSYVFALDAVELFGLSFPGFGMGIMGVWVAMACDWVVRGTLYTVRFLRDTWLKKGMAIRG